MSQFTELLLEWYARHRRDLPWRDCGNPYHVLLSEIILQQTRVSQGLDYYHRFLALFPTIEDLARADLDAVLKAWQGLGYYTRARNLHKTAKIIVEEYGGRVPSDYETLLTLPGLGPYAAGAVASFAFHEPVPAIDGNVYRVISRVYGIFESPGKAAGKKLFRQIVMELMDRKRPHLFNQALLDFGALQCTPGRPDCEVCPFLSFCYAACNRLQLQLPTKERATKMRTRYLHFFMLRWEGETILQRREQKDIWHYLYQFPLVELDRRVSVKKLFTLKETKELLGDNYRLVHSSEEIRQLLSHQELFIRFHIIYPQQLPATAESSYQRVEIENVFDYQVPISIHNYLVAEEAAPYFSDEPDARG